jgi:hypothetical protein
MTPGADTTVRKGVAPLRYLSECVTAGLMLRLDAGPESVCPCGRQA